MNKVLLGYWHSQPPPSLYFIIIYGSIGTSWFASVRRTGRRNCWGEWHGSYYRSIKLAKAAEAWVVESWPLPLHQFWGQGNWEKLTQLFTHLVGWELEPHTNSGLPHFCRPVLKPYGILKMGDMFQMTWLMWGSGQACWPQCSPCRGRYAGMGKFSFRKDCSSCSWGIPVWQIQLYSPWSTTKVMLSDVGRTEHIILVLKVMHWWLPDSLQTQFKVLLSTLKAPDGPKIVCLRDYLPLCEGTHPTLKIM